MRKFIPLLDTLASYQKNWLKGDLSAGLTVGVMLIPQGMAYAMIAGLPPIYGLYASTVPLILYAIFGTSRQLAVGPVAMVSMLTAAGIGAITNGEVGDYISMAISLALLVGAIQFLLGVFRLGFLVNFLSHPVISGFTSAAALIIGMSQLKHLLGIDLTRSHHIHEILIEAGNNISQINWITVGIGVIGIALIIGVKKINKAIPGPLLAVVFGILGVKFLGLTDYGVRIVGEIPSGLPSFGFPDISVDSINLLLGTALAISLVSFMESIAVAKAIQSKHKDYKVDPNQELIALGASNLGGSLFQSYPVTGGFSRTAVNDQSGAKTGLASIISASLIFLTLLFLTPMFYHLPNALLASVIMVAVFGLIDVREPIELWNSNRTDFWMLITTFIATLSFGIEQGIGIGVLLSLAMIIFRSTRPHMAVLGKVPDTHFYRNIERFNQLEEREDVLIVRFDDSLYFANINYFKDEIDELVSRKGEQLKLVIINADSISNIDSSAIHVLKDITVDMAQRGLKLFITGVKGPVRDTMQKSSFASTIGVGNLFMSIQEAIDCFDDLCNQTNTHEFHEYTSQFEGSE